MAEYDTKVINAEVSLLLFDHLFLYAFAYDLQYPFGGISYKVYLKR